MKRLTRFGVMALSIALASSCATVPATPQQTAPEAPSAPSQENATTTTKMPVRKVQTVVECPGSGDVVPKPGASPIPFEQVEKLPLGTSQHLDFKSRKEKENGNLPEADKLYFGDDVPFDLHFVEGLEFAVIDSDGSDGKMTVALPAGYYDSYFGTTGKPGGTLTVSEPMYKQSVTLGNAAGDSTWSRIGIRYLPSGYGEYVLHVEPDALTGISGRWFALDAAEVENPPIPPLPPSIGSLSGPDQAMPGETVTVTATVKDQNNDVSGYTWTATKADGTAVAAPTGEASASWTAPMEAGSYLIHLTVDDPYYATKSCQPLPIAVPNLCPEGAIAGPTEVQPGAKADYTLSATDGNGDTLTWRWESTGGTVTSAGAWTAPKTAGTYTVRAIVNDGHGCEVPVTKTVTVPNLCPEPTLGKTGGGALPGSVMAGNTVGFTGSAIDANNDTVTWKWTASGGAITPASGNPAVWTAPAAAGQYTITGTADDGHGCQVPKSHTIIVIAPTPTPTPTPTPSGPGTIVKTWNLSYPGDRIAVGPNGNPWVTHNDYDRVSQLNKNGGVIGNWDCGGPPVDIAATAFNHAWVTLETGYVRYITDGTGATRQHLYAGSDPRDICVVPGGQTAYAAIAGESKVGYLFGTNAYYYWNALYTPTGIAVAEDGNVLTTRVGGGTQHIRKQTTSINPTGSKFVADYLTGAGPRDIQVDRINHRIWVVCEDTNVMTVLDSNGVRVTPDFSWRTPELFNHTDMAVDREGNGWIALGSKLRKFSPQGVLLADYGPATGVTVDNEGYILFTNGYTVKKMIP